MWKPFPKFHKGDIMKRDEKFIKRITKNGIVIVGEVLVDVISENDEVVTLFGGSPANIAVNLSHMGISNVTLHAVVGQDHHGRFIIDTLKQNNIDVSFIRLSTSNTSVVKINKTTETPIPTFDRHADYEIELSDALISKIKNSKILHFSYWPISFKKSFDTIKEMIKIAHEHDTLIGFDPNYHTALYNGGATIDDILELIKDVDIMKPSLDDAKRLFGVGYSHIEYLEKFVNLGVKVVVMTLGKDGLVASINGEIIEQDSLAKKIVDATGAGDAFYSGLYAGLIKDYDIKTVITLGSLCSAYNLKVVGGIAHIPSIENLLNEIKRSN